MIIPKDYKAKPNSLIDKLVLITGSAQGLGKASALKLASLGATIILLDKDLAKLEGVYDEIIASNYPEPILYPLDLLGATTSHYQDMQDALLKFNKLDGLVHNAAIIGTMMPIEQYDIKIWYKVMQINVNAPFILTQYCLPLLLKSKDARIVFISDKLAKKPKAYWGAYGVSKSALQAMAMIIADELEKTNIKTNTLDTGAMKTKLRSMSHPGENLDLLNTPEQISPAIAYLFSDEAKKLNAKQLRVCFQ